MNRDELVLEINSIIKSDKVTSIAYSSEPGIRNIATAKIREELTKDVVPSIMQLVDKYVSAQADKKSREDEMNIYCESCGGCGIIGCDGVNSFLDKHVAGKTDCKNGDSFVYEIKEHFQFHQDYHEPTESEVEEELDKILGAAYWAGRYGRDFDSDDKKKEHFIRFVTGQYLRDGVKPDGQ